MAFYSSWRNVVISGICMAAVLVYLKSIEHEIRALNSDTSFQMLDEMFFASPQMRIRQMQLMGSKGTQMYLHFNSIDFAFEFIVFWFQISLVSLAWRSELRRSSSSSAFGLVKNFARFYLLSDIMENVAIRYCLSHYNEEGLVDHPLLVFLRYCTPSKFIFVTLGFLGAAYGGWRSLRLSVTPPLKYEP